MGKARNLTEAPIRPDVEPLRVWRARRGLSQTDLARLAGVSRQTVSNLERGETRPMPLVREALADALDIPSEYVMELRDGRLGP